MTVGWRLAHVKTRQEHVAERNLIQQDYKVFCPYEVRTTRHAQQLKRVRRAVFPGYLFVYFDDDREPWRAINNTVGVLRLVIFGAKPSLAPHGFVENLRAMSDAQGVLIKEKLADHQFSVGDRIIIKDGPFTDFYATIESLSDGDRVRVLFDVMHSKAPVMLSRKDCAPA